MVFGLASCSKDDNSNSGGNGGGSGTNTQTSLVGTQWAFNDGEADITVSFPTASDVSVNVQTPRGPEYYQGTYTYSNGSGTINLTVGGQEMTITFTVSGNSMTAHNTPAGDVVLTLVGGNPQPGPQPGGDTNTLKSLVGTQWAFNDGEADVTVSFPTASDVSVNVQTPHGPEHYQGTYIYSNGNGTINLTIEGREFNIAFTVSGNTMTAYNTPSGDVTLILVNPQPGPQPGGNYPLKGTTWQTSFQEDSMYVLMRVTFDTTTCAMYMAVNGVGHNTEGTYTYTGTITSGQGTITIQDEGGPETGYFTVNGNEATVTSHGESHVFIRTDNGR